LVWLRRHLAAVLAGEPRVVLISGEAGVGKTRLMREVLAEATRQGASVFNGHCSEDFSYPYQPFQALIAEIERNPSAADADFGIDEELIRRAERHAETGPGEPASSGEVVHQKGRLFLAVIQVVRTLCRSRPVVVAIDGLYWADSPSLELLEELVFAASDAALRGSLPLLILATHRPADPDSRLARLLDRVGGEEFAHGLELPGLDEDEIEQLVRELGLARPSAQLVDTLSRATRGNPLFVQEALSQLERSGAIAEHGGQLVSTVAAEDLELPLRVAESIRANVAALSDDAHEILTLASLIGDRFSLAELSAITARAQDDLLGPVEEGLARGFLVDEADGFSFAHPVTRGVFRSAPSRARRQLLRAKIAAALESLHADQLDAHAGEIAELLIGAGPRADAAKLLHFSVKAGDRALAAFSPGDAARYYEAALAASRSIPGFSGPELPELYLRAGRAHSRNMDLGPCLEHLDQAIAGFEALGDVLRIAEARGLQLRSRLMMGEAGYGEGPETEALEQALEALGEEHPGLRARLCASLATVYFSRRQPERAEEMARRVLGLTEQVEELGTLSNAAASLGLAQFQRIRMDEARESMLQAIRLGRRAGDLWAQGHGAQRLPLPLLSVGELERAEQVGEEGVELARATHDWAGLSHAAACRTIVAAARGGFEAAERHAGEALSMARRSHYFYTVQLAAPAVACARALQGDWAGARDALGEFSRGEAGASGHSRAGALLQQLYTRVVELWSSSLTARAAAWAPSAQPATRASSPGLVDEWGEDAYALQGFCASVEIATLSGDAAAAELFTRPLREAWRKDVGFTTGWVYLLPRVLGVADAMQGRWDTAEEEFASALELAEESGASPELARVLLDTAHMCVSRGGADDTDRATGLLLTAHDRFEKLGMTPFAIRACALAEQLGFQIGPGSGTSWVGDSPDELEGSGPVESYQEPRERSFRIIFFSDMEGFTEALRRMGDLAGRRMIRLHDRVIRSAVREHGGSEIQHTGDGLMVAFPSASSAIRCAQRIHRDFERHGVEHPHESIRVRIGLHGGEPLIQEDRLFGLAVNAAARLCDRARPGATLVSDVVRQLVAGQPIQFSDCGKETLKGFSEPFRVFEVDLIH